MGLGVGGNYVWCLVVVVIIFIGLGEAKKAREVLKSSYGETSRKGGTNFCRGSSPLQTPCCLYKSIRGRLPIQFTL